MPRFGPRFFRYCLIGWKQGYSFTHDADYRHILSFCGLRWGIETGSLKILFLDNVNILECENNIPLKSCSDIVKEKKNESDLVTK